MRNDRYILSKILVSVYLRPRSNISSVSSSLAEYELDNSRLSMVFITITLLMPSNFQNNHYKWLLT